MFRSIINIIIIVTVKAIDIMMYERVKVVIYLFIYFYLFIYCIKWNVYFENDLIRLAKCLIKLLKLLIWFHFISRTSLSTLYLYHFILFPAHSRAESIHFIWFISRTSSSQFFLFSFILFSAHHRIIEPILLI